MGWWKVQNTEDIVGDDAFSILRVATTEVLRLYQREFDRSPTRSEWQRLIRNSLQPLEELESPRESLFNEDVRPSMVEIQLEKWSR